MGSELVDHPSGEVLWLDLGVWREVDDLEVEAISARGLLDCCDRRVVARGAVRVPVLADPYSAFIPRLDAAVYPYDWRDSIEVEGERLRTFLRFVAKRDPRPITLVGQSLGALVAVEALARAPDLDRTIDRLLLAAPPIGGSLRPLRVIESGSATPLEWLVRRGVLRRSAATLPVLPQLLIAPADHWPERVGDVALRHPVRTGDDLYRPAAWTNRYRVALRRRILSVARRIHRGRRSAFGVVTRRLAERTHLIVAVHGKTPYAATRNRAGGWVLHALPDPPSGRWSNGDGTVLLQASLVPGLPEDRVHVVVPERRESLHGDLLDRPETLDAVRALLDGRRPDLATLSETLERVDWSWERAGAPDPGETEHLAWDERARMRGLVPPEEWGENLDPEGDAATFLATEEAGLRVLSGEPLDEASTTIGRDAGFLRGSLRHRLLPLLC
jgi:pimeloyl-ACP methyl ester carboxylesterase